MPGPLRRPRGLSLPQPLEPTGQGLSLRRVVATPPTAFVPV